jgi:hypothetical protein
METIIIEGSYGDEVELYLNGYIGTKYGDYCKIESVDIENETVRTYLHGDFDFSRISYSCDEDDIYEKSISNLLKSKGIMKGSIICDNETDIEYEVSDIRLPDISNNIYVPTLIYSCGLEFKIFDIDSFLQNNRIIPYFTMVDKINNLLDEHLKFNGMREREIFVKNIIKIFENN